MADEDGPPAGDPAGAVAPGPEVATVHVKLPPFWPADPEVWFAQVEALFTTRRITSQKTKFDYIISSLSPEFATEVRDLILKPPTENPYDKLKEQLTRRTAASEQRKLQQLFNAEELGDRKPTQLLRRMQQLLGDRPGLADGTFLRELFLQRLPSNVRMVLASSPDTVTLDQLAEMADRISEVAAPPVSTVTVSSLTTELEQLRMEMSRLQNLVKSSFPRRPRSLSRSTPGPNRSPSPAPSNPPPDPTLCWYHQRFGDHAQKCRSPCARSSNDQASP